MPFWKSYVCSNKLDVQETNFSFAQFIRIRNHFLGCTIDDGGKTELELWNLIVTLQGNTCQNDPDVIAHYFAKSEAGEGAACRRTTDGAGYVVGRVWVGF